jgi:hypothetical protein
MSDAWLGVGCLAAFLLAAALLLVWALVIAPRRGRRLLGELEDRGFAEIDPDSPDLQAAVDALAPIMLEGTVRFEEGKRDILGALAQGSGAIRRYIVNVSQRDESGADAVTIWQTFFLETRPLPFQAEVCIRLHELDRSFPGREEKFGFRRVEPKGSTPDFAGLHTVFVRGEATEAEAEVGVGAAALPPALQRAFVDVARILPASSNYTTRFGPSGWGLSATEAWQDHKALRSLIAAAERISASFGEDPSS